MNNVQLLVNNPTTINVKLEVGQVTESVTVKADVERFRVAKQARETAAANLRAAMRA